MQIKEEEINKAVALLQSGDVVAIPTETVYGLAASITSEKAISEVFKLKERPFFDPLIVHISNFKQLELFTKTVTAKKLEFAKCFWPGPLTLIFDRKESLNNMICSGLDTVGVRMPEHPMALEVISRLAVPVAAPSANKFGKTSPTAAAHVIAEWPALDLFVLDGGECLIGIESTVLSFEELRDFYLIEIYGPGFITEEKIKNLKIWDKPVEIRKVESSQSPGHLPCHYQPSKPLVIIDSMSEKLETLNKEMLEKIRQRLNLNRVNYACLDLGEIPEFAARLLYFKLRELSKLNIDFIYVQRKSNNISGLWDSIWDRLNRAASLRIAE